MRDLVVREHLGEVPKVDFCAALGAHDHMLANFDERRTVIGWTLPRCHRPRRLPFEGTMIG